MVNVIGAGLFTIFDVFFLFRSIRLSWHLNKPGEAFLPLVIFPNTDAARTGDGRYEPTVSDLLMCIQVSMCNFFFAIVPLCVVGAPFLGLRGLTAQVIPYLLRDHSHIPNLPHLLGRDPWFLVRRLANCILHDHGGYFRILHSSVLGTGIIPVG